MIEVAVGDAVCWIDDDRRKVQTVFADGAVASAVPVYDPESIARARALGYRGSDEAVVWAMTRDHDLLHSIVAANVDGGESHALRYAAGRESRRDRRQLEERLVFLVQRALNMVQNPVADAYGRRLPQAARLL